METYKKFQCDRQGCDFALWKIVAGRQFEPEEIETLISSRQVGPLQGFRSKQGRPFAAMIRLTADFTPEFDFGQDDKNADGASAEIDFTGKEPVGPCPKCHSRVFENGMYYLCEKSVGAAKSCDFRSGAIILQQPIDRQQMAKLLSTGKTDLLTKFVSKRNGRTFKAYLALKEGGVEFEFEPRPARGTAAGKGTKSKEPKPKIDFTGMTVVGQCPRCGGRVFETPEDYLCEKSQADKRPCRFKLGRKILQRQIPLDQAAKILKERKSDLIDQFISKAGRPFSAWLVLGDDGKVTFEFPEREAGS
jgi:DNA-directed RNA polymerase subunit RPC12/RpoP